MSRDSGVLGHGGGPGVMGAPKKTLERREQPRGAVESLNRGGDERAISRRCSSYGRRIGTHERTGRERGRGETEKG